MYQTFEIFTHKTPNPRWGGVGLILLLLFSAVHEISQTFDIFDAIKFPLRPPLGQFFIG